jgi:hypothetical protein
MPMITGQGAELALLLWLPESVPRAGFGKSVAGER